jgi:hypothetical protein
MEQTDILEGIKMVPKKTTGRPKKITAEKPVTETVTKPVKVKPVKVKPVKVKPKTENIKEDKPDENPIKKDKVVKPKIIKLQSEEKGLINAQLKLRQFRESERIYMEALKGLSKIGKTFNKFPLENGKH